MLAYGALRQNSASDRISSSNMKNGRFRGRSFVRRIRSSARRNLQPAFHARTRGAALEPRDDVREIVKADELTRAVERYQVIHPAQRGDVRDGVLVTNDP